MRNKLLISVLCAVMLLGAVAGAVTMAYAWLSPGKTVPVTADGSAVANYFAGGTGDKDDPYILTNAKHVYNLAWLQYMGVFNTEKNDDGTVKQFYFKVANNINMETVVDNTSYRVIPPIGTIQYPFIGNFDGNGKIISNAIVSNVIDDNEITVYPPSVDKVRDAEIIGFFGVIGEFTDDTILTTKEQLSALAVYNLLLDTVIVQTSATQSLAGLFAGYVNGNLTDVHVASGTITARPNVSALTGTYGALEINKNGALSAYSLIGDYNTTDINWLGGPMDGPTSDSGVGEGFGGSIDMLSLAERITYMYGAASPDTSTVSSYYLLNSTISSRNHAVLKNYSSAFSYTKTTAQTLYVAEGTYLPLNINLENLNQSYYTNNAEEALTGNTGFIVGKKAVTGRQGNTDFSLRSRKIGQLCNSMQGGSSERGAWKTLLYTDAVDGQLQILTKDVQGNYCVIGDNVNQIDDDSDLFDVYKDAGIHVKTLKQLGLTQYDGATANRVRTKLGDMLKANSMLYGLYFPTDSMPSENVITTISNGVSMGEMTVNSLVQGTVHFTLQRAGVITMVAATLPYSGDYIVGELGQSARDYYLPMLYQVVRDDDEDPDIDRLVEVKYICKDDTTGSISILTSLTNGAAPAGKTLVYNYDTMAHLTSSANGTLDKACMQSLFYYEIPIMSGEYVFGGNGYSSAESAYLIYLDIGANAGTQGSGGEDNPGGTTAEYTGELNGVYFVDGLGADRKPILQNVTPDEGKTAPAVAYQIMLGDTNGVSIQFDGTDTDELLVVVQPWTGNAEVTLVVKKEEETDGS